MLKTRREIKDYLDRSIKNWREDKQKGDERAIYYIDAFQSVRVSVFGEKLVQDEEEKKGE